MKSLGFPVTLPQRDGTSNSALACVIATCSPNPRLSGEKALSSRNGSRCSFGNFESSLADFLSQRKGSRRGERESERKRTKKRKEEENRDRFFPLSSSSNAFLLPSCFLPECVTFSRVFSSSSFFFLSFYFEDIGCEQRAAPVERR